MCAMTTEIVVRETVHITHGPYSSLDECDFWRYVSDNVLARHRQE